METKVSSAAKEVIISGNLPTRLIGERINPSGRKRLTQALQSGDLDMVRKEAIAQVKAGADIIDVNVGATGIDEAALLPKAVKIVMEAVDVPICIDAESPKALEAALKVYKGKPIVNSVKGEKKSLETVLPLIKEYGAAVIGLTIDDDGLPKTADKRVAIAARIIEWAEKLGSWYPPTARLLRAPERSVSGGPARGCLPCLPWQSRYPELCRAWVAPALDRPAKTVLPATSPRPGQNAPPYPVVLNLR